MWLESDFNRNSTALQCAELRSWICCASLCQCMSCQLSSYPISVMLQAALALAEWCLCNCKFLHNKHVLELGSGVGLTGLCVSLHCKPSSYWFSDCHSAVLSMLQSNILLNVTGLNDQVPGESDEQNAVMEHTYNKTNVTSLSSDDREQSEICNRCHILLRTRCNNTEIGVINLPWEAVPVSDVVDRLSPEVVLAAGASTV